MTPELHLTGDPAADKLLSRDPLALLIGMLLDQQIPMETAFTGPEKLRNRLNGLDAAAIADHDPEALVGVFRATPAVHRFPGSMAARVQTLCRSVVEDWHDDATAIWTDGDPDATEVLRRLRSLPGFGEQKAKIFIALLGKQYGVTPEGWREVSAPYGEKGSYRSVADIVDADTLSRVRETKRAVKAAAKSGARAD